MPASLNVPSDNARDELNLLRQTQLELSQGRDRLKLLLAVNNAVVSHLGLDEMIVAIRDSLASVIPHDVCCLLLFDPKTRHYRCHVLPADGAGSVEPCCQPSRLRLPPAGHRSARRPAAPGRTLRLGRV